MRKELLFATLAIIASGTVYADVTFSLVDADKSGSISKKEAAVVPSLSKQWDNYDSNTDGKLDEAEFARFELAEPKASEKVK